MNKSDVICRIISDYRKENAPLGEQSYKFFALTVGWIILGGVLQTCILLYVRFRQEYFTNIPEPIKFLVYLTIPTWVLQKLFRCQSL